jgi:hypothetical protein
MVSSSSLLIQQFQLPSGQLLRTLSGHSSAISNIFVVQENVFSLSNAESVYQWNLTSPSSSDIPSVATSAYLVRKFQLNGTTLTAASVNNQSLFVANGTRVWLFDVPTGQLSSTILPIAGASVSTLLAMDGYVAINVLTNPVVYNFANGSVVFNYVSTNFRIPARNGDILYVSNATTITAEMSKLCNL